MSTVEKFLVLLFGAIVVGIVVTNPNGIAGILNGLAGFSSQTVKAFSGGFAAKSGSYIPGGY